MGTISTIITILSFACALAAISRSIDYITNKVNRIEMDSKACLEEVKDIHREMYHWFDTMGGEARHTRKVVEEIDKRV